MKHGLWVAATILLNSAGLAIARPSPLQAQNARETQTLRAAVIDQLRRDRPEYQHIPPDSILVALTILGSDRSGASLWWAEAPRHHPQMFLLATDSVRTYRLGGFEPNDVVKFADGLPAVHGKSVVEFADVLSRIADPNAGWAVFSALDSDSSAFGRQLQTVLYTRLPPEYPIVPRVTRHSDTLRVDLSVLSQNQRTGKWVPLLHHFRFSADGRLKAWTFERGPEIGELETPNDWTAKRWSFGRASPKAGP